MTDDKLLEASKIKKEIDELGDFLRDFKMYNRRKIVFKGSKLFLKIKPYLCNEKTLEINNNELKDRVVAELIKYEKELKTKYEML